MFWFHTPVLDSAPAGRFRPSNGSVVVNAKLKPDDIDVVTGEGLVDDPSNYGTWSKDVTMSISSSTSDVMQLPQ